MLHISFEVHAMDGRSRQVKYIILTIGDGMNIQHELATNRYRYGKDNGLSFHKFPYQANVATWDVSTYKYWSSGTCYPNAIIPRLGYDTAKAGKRPYPLGPELACAQAYQMTKATDSASTATAWAAGYKTNDGNLAWLPDDPDSGTLKTIAGLLREEKSYAMGVDSTVPLTHATQAAHISHNKSRNNQHAIR